MAETHDAYDNDGPRGLVGRVLRPSRADAAGPSYPDHNDGTITSEVGMTSGDLAAPHCRDPPPFDDGTQAHPSLSAIPGPATFSVSSSVKSRSLHSGADHSSLAGGSTDTHPDRSRPVGEDNDAFRQDVLQPPPEEMA